MVYMQEQMWTKSNVQLGESYKFLSKRITKPWGCCTVGKYRILPCTMYNFCPSIWGKYNVLLCIMDTHIQYHPFIMHILIFPSKFWVKKCTSYVAKYGKCEWPLPIHLHRGRNWYISSNYPEAVPLNVYVVKSGLNFISFFSFQLVKSFSISWVIKIKYWVTCHLADEWGLGTYNIITYVKFMYAVYKITYKLIINLKGHCRRP